MNCELKSYKPAHQLSEETLAFTASLWIDGKRAAECSNRGHGDPINFHFQDRGLEKQFYAWCESLPPIVPATDAPEWEKEMGPLAMNAELYVAQLCEETDRKQWMKRQTRKKTLFRIKGDAVGAYRTIAKRGSEVVSHIKNKYGEKLLEIC